MSKIHDTRRSSPDDYVEEVKAFAWIHGYILVAKMTSPVVANIYETRGRLFERAKEWTDGEVDETEVGSHFFWFLKSALREVLDAVDVRYDVVETRLVVDFGSASIIGNLNTGEVGYG